MRTFDFAPLYRSTVGFDRMANILDRAMATGESSNGYPQYNIEKSGEDSYRITVAVAGFSDAELSVETRDGQLVIAGKKPESKPDGETSYLHRGIATRAFERRFQLADHIRAVGRQPRTDCSTWKSSARFRRRSSHDGSRSPRRSGP